jgi:hypothetical protein
MFCVAPTKKTTKTKQDFFRDWLRSTTTAIRQLWGPLSEWDVFFWCSTCSSSRGSTTSATGTAGDTLLLLAPPHQLLLKASLCRTAPSRRRPHLARPPQCPLLTSSRYMSHPPPTRRSPRVRPFRNLPRPQDSQPLRALPPLVRHQCLLSDHHPPAVGVQWKSVFRYKRYPYSTMPSTRAALMIFTW